MMMNRDELEQSGFELWADERNAPGSGGVLPIAVLILALFLWDLPRQLAKDPSVSVSLALGLLGCLLVVIIGLFLFQSRQQLSVNRSLRRVVSVLVWGSWVVQRVELDFDDITQIKTGWPYLRRSPWGRHAVVAVQRRGATRLLVLQRFEQAETIAERLRRVIGIQ